jgi:glycosyltransferase involved in cell wall biosynthesis
VAHTDILTQRGLSVALVHDWLTVPAGSEDVFREICAMYPGTVFTSQWDRERVKFIEGMDVRTSFVQHMPLALKKHYLYAPFLPRAYRGFETNEFDVILSDSHSFAHGVRKKSGGLHINYYHTPARSLWTPEIDPRATSGHLAPLKRAIAARLKTLDLESSKNPDVILANSRTTAARIRKFYEREVDAVIYPPVDTGKWLDTPREADDLGYLVFGRLIGYKRVDLAIEAAKQMGVKLQIVGSGPLEKELKAQAAGCSNITFHGRLPDAELKQVMSLCRALLFPGYEDFGIVPVEAMAAGLPVVAYGVGGAGETVMPECGTLFYEQSVSELVEAMRSLDSKSIDERFLRNHALQFDRARFQREYSEIVERAVEERLAPVKAYLA